MLPSPDFFAAANPADVLPAPPSGATTQLFKDVWFLAAVALGLGVLFLVWAKFTHGGRSDARRKRRRVEGARHGQRPSNPTLAETGGLPPVRPDDTPPPAATRQ